MGMYAYIKKTFQNRSKEDIKDAVTEWRKQPATLRIKRPTRLDRARNLGYKAKQGIILVRQRVKRGGHERTNYRSGKRPKRNTIRVSLNVNYQHIAEVRAVKGFPNCEVLNSYYVGKDGKHYWYEVILVDRAHPAVLKDPNYSWIARPSQTRRAHRGLTSAARKSRGLRVKGKGAEKIRPSRKKALQR
ncbi:MAG: 50S ribosomal protein L15e [Nanoarchaeota archaeon]